MTPTPECIEAVARAIGRVPAYPESGGRKRSTASMFSQEELDDLATAAIEAATPFIRQQVLDELIAELQVGGVGVPNHFSGAANWLRARKADGRDE